MRFKILEDKMILHIDDSFCIGVLTEGKDGWVNVRCKAMCETEKGAMVIINEELL